ncbi:MAG: hypothetical protein AB7D38_05050 [Sulfurimonas sp.]|uniref:hypothetical protein n=1 Tax=Sulfurimonas sp. TaxID=2022749 RepID=UPI003D0EC30C
MRANYALDLQKSIYEKTAYPSNKGGFEKAFLEYLDTDSKVLKFYNYLNTYMPDWKKRKERLELPQ